MYTSYCTCKRTSAWCAWNLSTASVDPRYFLRASCLSTMFPGPKEIVPSACKGKASAKGGAGVTLGSRYRNTKWPPSPMRSPGLRTASLYRITPLWLTAPPLNGRSRAVGTIGSSFMDHEFKKCKRMAVNRDFTQPEVHSCTPGSPESNTVWWFLWSNTSNSTLSVIQKTNHKIVMDSVSLATQLGSSHWIRVAPDCVLWKHKKKVMNWTFLMHSVKSVLYICNC